MRRGVNIDLRRLVLLDFLLGLLLGLGLLGLLLVSLVDIRWSSSFAYLSSGSSRSGGGTTRQRAVGSLSLLESLLEEIGVW
jgi:hypothetical protein